MKLSIAREAWPFAIPTLLLAVLLTLWHWWAGLPAAALAAFVLWFFRDPERIPPDDPLAVLSPADGKVIKAADGRLSIFLNVFNVHVCRAPRAGTLASYRHIPGRFLAAFRDEASEQNERAELRIEDRGKVVKLTLVAGLIARRIVPWVEAGQFLAPGQRIGLIRFGSRVDLDLPPDARLEVRVGDTVVAGVSVLAHLPGPRADGSAHEKPV